MMRLEAINLSVRRKDCVLVQAASLAATSGEFIGLVGPNGAGKTTLLRSLAGLEAAAAGHVAIDCADIRTMTPRERARKLSYLPQAREVAWSITAEAVVALGRFAYGTPARLGPEDRAAVDRALALTDAGAFRTRTMPTLSGGEQARIHLARALAAETPILLADEPTAALDPKHARAIMQALRAKADDGGIVFAALHDLRLARRWCSRIIVMNEGDLVADDDAERAMTPAIMEIVFGAGLADL